MTERITIIGAGTVGAHLTRALRTLGHEVRLAARNVNSDKVQAVRAELGLHAVPLTQATSDTDIVVLAVPFPAVAETAAAIAPAEHVIVVDATNSVGAELPPGADSILDMLAAAGIRGQMVKAFNTIGAEAYVTPTVQGHPLFLPVAGDDPAADRIRDIAAAMGFDALVIGDRSAARLNEHAAELWIHLAFRVGLGREFGFARLHRPAPGDTSGPDARSRPEIGGGG